MSHTTNLYDSLLLLGPSNHKPNSTGEKTAAAPSHMEQQIWQHPAPLRTVMAFRKGTTAALLAVSSGLVSVTKAAAQQVLLQMAPKHHQEQNHIALSIHCINPSQRRNGAFPGLALAEQRSLCRTDPAHQLCEESCWKQ